MQIGEFFKNTFIPSADDTKQKRVSKIIACVVTVLIIAALVAGGLVIGKYARERKETEKNQAMMSSGMSSETSSEDDTDVNLPVVGEEPIEDLDVETGVLKEFVELYKTNSDVIGWIKIDGTKLDQPVVKGTDNSYYLDKTIEKKHNAFGVPFADYRTMVGLGVQSDNITIYGHAAKDGTFFTPVKEYNDIKFYQEHPTLTFNTIYGKGEYKVIGRFIEYVDLSNTKMFNYHDYIDFASESTYNKFVNSVKERSYFNTTVDTQYGDKFITLSTCNVEIIDSLKTPYRDVLVARKVRPGESTEVDVAGATINKGQLMPDGWVKKFGKKNPYN